MLPKRLSPLALAAAAALAPGAALAQGYGPGSPNGQAVGLGVGAGIAVPSASMVNTGALKTAFAWGFYTDIPLISTFHITPQTIVYRIDPMSGGGGVAATDVSLNFKFIIPIRMVSLFAGVTAGVTSHNTLDPHVGALLGGSINLVSNLDVFINAGYRLVLASEENGGNVKDFQILAGPLFRFNY